MSAWIAASDVRLVADAEFPTDGSSSDDRVYAFMADAACSIFEKLTLMAILEQTRTIYLDGSGSQRLFVPGVPIISAVSQVWVDGGELTVGTLDELHLGTVTASFEGRHLLSRSGWDRGLRNVKATLTAGYLRQEIPEAWRYAAAYIAALLTIDGPRIGKTSSGLTGASDSFERELPPVVRMTIEHARSLQQEAVYSG